MKMKNLSQIITIATILFFTASCGGDATKDTSETKKDKKASCFYSYNSGSSILEWTSFKFTEKTPVKGTFNDIKVEGLEKSDDPIKLIESLSFTISTVSVETNNDDRNAKIAKLFFGTINTENITGSVKSLKKNGKATISLKMNSQEHHIIGNYTLVDGKFDFSSTIDVLKWNAGKGLSTLNQECKDLHTSTDGKSKLWSEVELKFSTELMSDCD